MTDDVAFTIIRLISLHFAIYFSIVNFAKIYYK